jgi:hypothetical protein
MTSQNIPADPGFHNLWTLCIIRILGVHIIHQTDSTKKTKGTEPMYLTQPAEQTDLTVYDGIVKINKIDSIS